MLRFQLNVFHNIEHISNQLNIEILNLHVLGWNMNGNIGSKFGLILKRNVYHGNA